ncbi:MAG: hypothetical protein ACK520_01275 [Inhella sp.]|uniref:hypothetical protein n=1 Tax=Inhella sp. TaxID=1921806 RepID=UPI00345BDC00
MTCTRPAGPSHRRSARGNGEGRWRASGRLWPSRGAPVAHACALADHTTKHVRTRRPKIDTRELVDVILEPPYCRKRDPAACTT